MSAQGASQVRVLLVVSGGIAAYKAPALVRALVKLGAQVRVVMTEAATAFVSELALATVSGSAVRTRLLDVAQEGSVGHIELADWPQLVLVAPATANIMARAALGLADDLATTVLLATRAPLVWAPAMNSNMWSHPATQAHVSTLRARGHAVIGPEHGDLACGWVGEGKMSAPEVIADQALAEIQSRQGAQIQTQSWRGRKVLVSAGPTRAYLDPVRFLTNASTGVMGFAIAEAAARQGAEVTLVAGPVELATPAGVARIDVETAEQMLTAMDERLTAAAFDLVAMVAAVADLRPVQRGSGKLSKVELLRALSAGAFEQGVDVLATLAARHHERSRFLGFGAQTVASDDPTVIRDTLVAAGRTKLKVKGCHSIFVNRVGVAGSGFASATNTGFLLHGDDDVAVDAGPPRSKFELARWLLDQMAAAGDANLVR